MSVPLHRFCLLYYTRVYKIYFIQSLNVASAIRARNQKKIHFIVYWLLDDTKLINWFSYLASDPTISVSDRQRAVYKNPPNNITYPQIARYSR